MALLKFHRFSLIRFLKDAALAAPSTPKPVFVDLDAHANAKELPKAHLFGVSGFSMQWDGALLTVFADFTVSAWGDPNLVLHTELLDYLAGKLEPGDQIPLLLDAPGVGQPSWMIVADDVSVEPMQRDNERALQTISVRLLSGKSGYEAA